MDAVMQRTELSYAELMMTTDPTTGLTPNEAKHILRCDTFKALHPKHARSLRERAWATYQPQNPALTFPY